jgi:DNA-binding MarR family transcriptional regulator
MDMSKPIVHDAAEYLTDTTGLHIASLKPYTRDLPPFLEQTYRLHVMHTAVGRFLMIEHIGEELITPLTYEKHLTRIMQAATDFDSTCVVFENLPFYVRQRYAHRGLAFIVPGTQLNWPQLGLALQKRSRARRRDTPQDVLPATQLLLLYTLVHGIPEPVSVKALSERLSYSPMTISRALDQVDAQELGKTQRIGRERVVAFNPNRQELWREIRGFLDSPVAREVRVLRRQLEGVEHVLAGETALARYTTLVEPQEKIFAVSPGTWQELKRNTEAIPVPDDTTCILQLWRYDPGILQTDGITDPFSLWLSMRSSADERLQIALDQLLDKDEGRRNLCLQSTHGNHPGA